MASQEETMRLVAELLDKTSGPLKDIQKSLRDTAAVAKKMTGDGTQGTKDHAKAYSGLHESIEKTRRELSGSFTPAMAALGLTTFGAGEAIGKVIEQLKGLSEQYVVMRNATRRTGASADFLESTAIAIERLTGQAPEEAIQNLANMREQMDRLSRQRPDTVNAWKNAYTGLYETLGKDLMGKTLPQQIEEVFEWFSSHPDIAIDKKRDVLSLMGLNPDLATARIAEVRAALKAGIDFQAAHPYEGDIAEKLNKSFNDLKETIRGAGWEINHAFGGEGASLIEKLSTSLHTDVEDLKAMSGWLDVIAKKLGLGEGGGDPMGRIVGKLLDQKTVAPKATLPITPIPPPTPLTVPRGGVFPGGSYHPAAFTTGGDAENLLTRSTKEGMLAAFREWFASTQSGGGSGGGFTNAAFTPSGAKIDNTPIGQQIRQQLEGAADDGASSKGGGHRALAKALGLDKTAGGGGTPGVGPAKGAVEKGGDPRGLESYIRETAKKYNVDPDTAVAVAKSEGLGNFQSGIAGEKSYGAFQLHTGGGLGDTYKKETGLDPSDPKNERSMIDWSLKNVNKTGWSPYHGAKNTGIGPRAGLGGGGDAGAGVVPSDVLAGARKVALQGGPGAVQQFMAANGYPKAGNWCGEFAASAVHAAGGTPPKNPAIASNWRNWGSPTDHPVPGDIAVRRGVPTGSTGSHVNIVESYDPKSGTFKGLGGNQGAFERDFSSQGPRGYDFRHQDRDLLHTAAKNPVASGGGGSQTIKGDASLDINLNGFPKGTKTDVTYGGLFTQYTLAKGQQMEAAKSE
jgi:hypothetical protein